MKTFSVVAFFFALSSSAFAVSNGVLPQYVINEGCGPQDKIPQACAEDAGVAAYCDGFQKLVSGVSHAGLNIPKQPYAVWCWTILEDWTQCRIPSPRLQFQCGNYVKQLASPSGEESCQKAGFEAARQMYLDDVARQCPATE